MCLFQLFNLGELIVFCAVEPKVYFSWEGRHTLLHLHLGVKPMENGGGFGVRQFVSYQFWAVCLWITSVISANRCCLEITPKISYIQLRMIGVFAGLSVNPCLCGTKQSWVEVFFQVCLGVFWFGVCFWVFVEVKDAARSSWFAF